VLLLALGVSTPVAAGKRHAELRVESSPPGALVSVSTLGDSSPGSFLTIAGETPLTKTFTFPKKYDLLLRFEKTGFHPKIVDVSLGVTRVSVELAPLSTEIVEPKPVRILALVRPEIEVIRRGFSAEHEDESAGNAAADAIRGAVRRHLDDEVEIVEFRGPDDGRILRPLWRDVQTQMEFADPIRLPYLAVTPSLESRAAREALLELVEETGADAVLFVAGKTNVETGGMKAGKIGIMVAGTANSFASGYSSAMSSGSDFFTYTIYLPSFAEGMGLEALLLDTRDNTIRWANKGMWKPLPVARPEIAEAVAADLLTGIETVLSTNDQPQPNEERP
jgi:hypothetical protein